MTLKKMTNGDSEALKVLAAERLGLEPACVDFALDQLNGKPVPPMSSARLSKVATDMHNRIASDADLVARANVVVAEIYNTYFPAH